ncbi:MAG TPA: DUF4136 domain-containing protein [Desulfobacterales bacterium]|nr:DUF4136 domain-containing protein [Desulfobacterales bacterium]
MKRLSLYGLVGALLIFCGACSTLSVSTDYNPAYDFTKLKTYAWLDSGKAPGSDARINNDLVKDRVQAAVERTLAARGYVKTSPASADFRVSWLGAIDKKLEMESIDHFYSPYGYGTLIRDPYWGASARRTVTTREYEVGTLVIDILDPVEHKLIWRGTGKDRIGGTGDPEKITTGINEAVTAIMESFPPAK